MKILVTPTSLQPGKNEEVLNQLREFSDDLVFNPYGRPLTEDELKPLLKDCDGYIAGLDYITAEALKEADRLKVISRYGAGFDRVDIAAASAKGIYVTNTPGVNAQAVGELTFALILSAARKVPYLDYQTKNGGWIRSTGIELAGKTIGILGLGAIGKVVAKCAQGFSMNVIAYDPFIDKQYCTKNNIKNTSIDEVFNQSDVISLHLPLNEKTKHLIDETSINKMKRGAIIVNASRGGIVDEDAAYKALVSGQLGGMGLDAFEEEPPKNSPLFELDNVVTTPHTGAHTKEATINMAKTSIENLIHILKGEECRFIINK